MGGGRKLTRSEPVLSPRCKPASSHTHFLEGRLSVLGLDSENTVGKNVSDKSEDEAEVDFAQYLVVFRSETNAVESPDNDRSLT